MNGLVKVLFLLISLTAFLYSKEGAVEKISLQLAWKHQFQFAGYYIAKEKGFYSDVNLDVAIREHNGHDVVEEVNEKKADYGIGRSSLIVDIANGKKLKMLSAVFQASPSVFVALKNSNISTVKDFKSKKIMVTQDMSWGVSLQAMLQKNGLDIADMRLQKHSYTIESLISGKTDIMASYISNEPFLLQEKGKEAVVFSPADEGFDFYSDILFTTDEELLVHPKRAEAFVNASLRGWEYAFTHIDETVALILEKYNTQNKSKEALVYEATALKKLAYEPSIALGELKYEKLQRIYDLYNVMGLIKKEMKVEKLYFPLKKKLLTLKEENYLEEKKVIKFCIDPDWLPYEKIENGEYIGISADYINLFKKKMKIEFELVQTEHWEESLKFVKQRKCDILPLALKTPSREAYLNFTEPYLDMSVVLATRPKVPFIDNFNLLKEKKIGATKGFAFIEVLKKKYPNFIIVEVKNTQDGLRSVVDGDIFGYVGSLVDIGYQFENNFVGELKVSGKFEDKWTHSVAVRNDEAILLNIFNKVLKSITLEQKKAIQGRWISIKYEEKRDFTLLWWLFGLVLFAFSMSVILYARQKEINKIIQDQASKDYMTQLYNRRYFSESAAILVDLARRNSTDVSLVMIDIDNFKYINDTYSHTSGDETIKALAKVMLEQSRKSDMVARWGGEEFVILLPETNIEGASVIAEKIRRKVENLTLKTVHSKEFSITISLGIARVCIEMDINIEAAIMRADKALYEAKKSGKNRVCVNRDELLI